MKNHDSLDENGRLEAELFEAISHPTRITILRYLSQSSLGFAELKRKLGLSSSGNLGHHLTKLVSLITSDATGRYTISDQGREALLALHTLQSQGNSDLKTHVKIAAILWYALWMSMTLFFLTYDVFLLVTVNGITLLSTTIWTLGYWQWIRRGLRKGNLRLKGLFQGYTGV